MHHIGMLMESNENHEEEEKNWFFYWMQNAEPEPEQQSTKLVNIAMHFRHK